MRLCDHSRDVQFSPSSRNARGGYLGFPGQDVQFPVDDVSVLAVLPGNLRQEDQEIARSFSHMRN